VTVNRVREEKFFTVTDNGHETRSFIYQLDLISPGISPFNASLRKHNLHILNFL